jgi:hypothetical protein
MRGLAIAGIAYRDLVPQSGLVAPILLATRRADPSAALARFRQHVRDLAPPE